MTDAVGIVFHSNPEIIDASLGFIQEDGHVLQTHGKSCLHISVVNQESEGAHSIPDFSNLAEVQVLGGFG
jgi:hypothetical protein